MDKGVYLEVLSSPLFIISFIAAAIGVIAIIVWIWNKKDIVIDWTISFVFGILIMIIINSFIMPGIIIRVVTELQEGVKADTLIYFIYSTILVLINSLGSPVVIVVSKYLLLKIPLKLRGKTYMIKSKGGMVFLGRFFKRKTKLLRLKGKKTITVIKNTAGESKFEK